MDDVLFHQVVTCDQQLSVVGPVIPIVLRPSNRWPHWALVPSVCPTQRLERYEQMSDISFLVHCAIQL